MRSHLINTSTEQRITALILTKNEEYSLPRLLASLDWVHEIIVVDSLSTDNTVSLAQSYGAKVIVQPLVDFSSQWNAGLKKATGDWVFTFDADEHVPHESAQLFLNALSKATPDVGGFRILRRNYALGCWLKHGQQYGKVVHWFDFVRRRRGYKVGEVIGGSVKLFRRQDAVFENLVHEEVRVPGRIIQLQGFVNHYTADSIQDMFDKVSFYTTLHAKQLYEKNPTPPKHFYLSILWVPCQTFLKVYLRKRAILDGFPGLARAFSSTLYEFLKNIKLYDYYFLKRS